MANYTLYGYFRSSCTARIRLALNLKDIPFEYIPVNLLKDEHLAAEHRNLNPSATVPLLVRAGDGQPLRIGQSIAALEYIVETHRDQGPALLPADAETRALVRILVNVIACDTQPVTNLRIGRRVRQLGGDPTVWNKDLTTDGLAAYEAVCAARAGTYSVGDEITLADVCLLPAVWNARRFEVDMSKLPTITRVADNLEKISAVQKASYFVQVDTPEDLRA